MPPSAAIAYTHSDYEGQSYAVAGRKTAGEGFFRGYVAHGSFDAAVCFTHEAKAFSDFCQQVRTWSKREIKCADSPAVLGLDCCDRR